MTAALGLQMQRGLESRLVPHQSITDRLDFAPPNYKTPHVIMEHLATDFLEPVTTQFYTISYSQRVNRRPNSEELFIFPSELSIKQLIPRFQVMLNTAGIVHKLTPETIEDKTELVLIGYTSKHSLFSEAYTQSFLPLLYAAVCTFVKQQRAIKLGKTISQ